MRFKARIVGKAVMAIIALALLGLLVMRLWNAVIPSLFVGARPTDYLHALGLLVLSRILFGGFRGRGGGGFRQHGWDRCGRMTEDERARLRRSAFAGVASDGETAS
jgi:hypothetical protein